MFIQTVSLDWPILLTTLTVAVQEYMPLSWTVRGLMVRLIFIPPEIFTWERVYLSPVIFLGLLHVAVTSCSVHILKCSVAVHVRVRAMPVYRGAL
jgi:hypothetical protein